MASGTSASSSPLAGEHIHDLHEILQQLAAHEFPVVPSPPETKRRASVALIIRVNPSYEHWNDQPQHLPTGASESDKLKAFFDQDWVRHGAPEILFIKRASRQGDRWTGHVAFPGGRRDPEDADDAAAAVRETSEEVGLDLTTDALAIGNLPQRVVTGSWGHTPLLVLCPYVYLLTTPHAPLRLQPTEVASAHWVPVHGLLARSLRTYERQDVSGRLARTELGLQRIFYRGMLGRMLFSAILLVPSTSVHSDPLPPYARMITQPAPSSLLDRIAKTLGSTAFDDLSRSPPPLHLWGLTLGVATDFLDLFPAHDSTAFWTYPTFAAPDVRLAIWALSARFRARRAAAARTDGLLNSGSLEIAAEAVISAKGNAVVPDAMLGRLRAGENPLAAGGRSLLRAGRKHEFDAVAFSTTLEMYYDYVRRGIALALGVRCLAMAGAAYWAYARYWRRTT